MLDRLLKGFKQASSKHHHVMRLVVAAVMVAFLIWSLVLEKEHEADMSNLCDHIKPNTILYNSIDELDGDAKKRYIQSINQSLEPEPPKWFKCVKNIQYALIGGIITEYLMNGNLDKPVSIIPKTVVTTALASVLSQ